MTNASPAQESTPKPAPAQAALPNWVNPQLVGNAWMQVGMLAACVSQAACDLRNLRGYSRATRELRLDELQRKLDEMSQTMEALNG